CRVIRIVRDQVAGETVEADIAAVGANCGGIAGVVSARGNRRNRASLEILQVKAVDIRAIETAVNEESAIGTQGRTLDSRASWSAQTRGSETNCTCLQALDINLERTIAVESSYQV